MLRIRGALGGEPFRILPSIRSPHKKNAPPNGGALKSYWR
jgi:hypothetical protein